MPFSSIAKKLTFSIINHFYNSHLWLQMEILELIQLVQCFRRCISADKKKKRQLKAEATMLKLRGGHQQFIYTFLACF